jgi:hypothetical protein
MSHLVLRTRPHTHALIYLRLKTDYRHTLSAVSIPQCSCKSYLEMRALGRFGSAVECWVHGALQQIRRLRIRQWEATRTATLDVCFTEPGVILTLLPMPVTK